MPPFCPFRYATGFRQVNRPFESLGDEKFGSSGRIRTYNPSVNSRMLYR